MDDRRWFEPTYSRGPRLLAVLLICISLAGCSLGVMAGKMLFGDPEIDCAFKQATETDLTEGDKRVIVIAETPISMQGDATGMSHDIVENVSRQLRRAGVDLVDSNKVRTWMDDNGGRIDDPRDLAADFDVDVIIHIDLQRVTFREPNSPQLFRGQAAGEISAYEVQEEANGRRAMQVFANGFASTYPSHNPVPQSQVDSPRIFGKRFMERVSKQIAYLFYDHAYSEEIK